MEPVKSKKRRNGNGFIQTSMFPTAFNDFFGSRLLAPDLTAMENYWKSGLRIPPANISETKNEIFP
jgi:hypothetical protein